MVMDGIFHQSLTKNQPSAAVKQVAPAPRADFLSQLLGTVSLWYRRAHERQELAHLSERDLHDLGLSRSDIYAELAKPFWRD
jgi:uncharacterized protein YjiS (DUF1127 family)